MLQLANGLSIEVVGEPSRPMAGGALARMKVAGPHAVQRQVVGEARAGGLLEVHAAGGWRWSAIVGPKRGGQSRLAVHAAQPNRLNGRLRLC